MNSLLPLDVGFDLKLQEIEVCVTEESSPIRYLDEHGREAVASGTPTQVASILRRAGYRVKVE